MRYIHKEHLAVMDAVSDDPTRYVLNSVRFEETETGLKAIATDGRIMAIIENSDDFPETDYPSIQALNDAPNTAKTANVHIDTLKQSVKGMPKGKKVLPILQTIALKMAEEISTLVTTDLRTPVVIGAQNLVGTFPQYEQVIPKDENTTFTIAFSPDLLARALTLVSKVTGGADVEMKFSSELEPVKIIGKHGKFSVTVVVMPVKIKK